jgi:hypothetical protein
MMTGEPLLSQSLRLKMVLQTENRPCRPSGSEGSSYVRTVIVVQTRAVIIIMSSGEDTLVVVIPILG